MNNPRRGIWRIAGILTLVAVTMSAVYWWPQPRSAFYSLYRSYGRTQALAALEGFHLHATEHFDIFYTEADTAIVPLVGEVAESVYGPVSQWVGYLPKTRVPIIMYPSRAELRKAFGWGQSESALGVYWRGTIRLLSPNVWLDTRSLKDQHRLFRKLNPLAHELTHYVLDYMTDGNYPRWFTEGLAQFVEYRISGYLWLERESSLRQPLYTLTDLERRFDSLSNQPLAYRQSYLIVKLMHDRRGNEGLSQLMRLLADGTEFKDAIKRVYGRTMEQLFDEWLGWVQTNIEELEAERR